MSIEPDPHISFIRPVTPRTPEGCEECLKIASPWESFQPGEDWRWCYVDERFV